MDSVTLVSQLILPYLFPIFKKILTISARYSYLSLVLPFGYGSVLISLLSLRASSGGEKTHLFRQRSSTGSLRSPLTSYLKLRWLSESGKVKFFFSYGLSPCWLECIDLGSPPTVPQLSGGLPQVWAPLWFEPGPQWFSIVTSSGLPPYGGWGSSCGRHFPSCSFRTDTLSHILPLVHPAR